MAQAQEPVTGQKRGPGRPPKTETPAKRARVSSISAITRPSQAVQSPAASTPVVANPKLPATLSSTRSLPTLSKAQEAGLPDMEYQSIAASAVLSASLERSRQQWTSHGIFERYWTKPETGKNARPPPPNNPDVKWMNDKGECRLRIEPHIFEVQMYVEEKPVVKQPTVKTPGQHVSAYGQPYKASPQTNAPRPADQTAAQALPPAGQQANGSARTLPPMTAGVPYTTPQPKKAAADPVISMLAQRASSDVELKALMKEVALGSATHEQLKVFQRHIDELQEQIKKEKDEDEKKVILPVETSKASLAAQIVKEEVIQYEGAADSIAPAVQPPQQKLSPPAAVTHPVVLAFKDPGASEDRFLFPQNSIVESLSPQHLLASFIIVRKGRDAIDTNGLDPAGEYWQPVTLMVEVMYGLEELLACVKRWVKPPDEVKRYMEATMERCTRAPETHLAMRLPIRSAGGAAGAGLLGGAEDFTSKESTPHAVVVKREEIERKKSNVKYIKKPVSHKKKVPPPAAEMPASALKKTVQVAEKAGAVGGAEKAVVEGGAAGPEGSAEGAAAAAVESGRPKRSVRKSVRISEG